eukprot:1541648-Amphidinium_carterae.1
MGEGVVEQVVVGRHDIAMLCEGRKCGQAPGQFKVMAGAGPGSCGSECGCCATAGADGAKW